MASVIERVFNETGSQWADRPSTYEIADGIAGRRLDRRCSYAIIKGDVCELVRFSMSCSGCNEGMGEKGAGCHECGYTGRSRVSQWVPISPATHQ